MRNMGHWLLAAFFATILPMICTSSVITRWSHVAIVILQDLCMTSSRVSCYDLRTWTSRTFMTCKVGQMAFPTYRLRVESVSGAAAQQPGAVNPA